MIMIHRALYQEKAALPEDATLSTFLSEYILNENDFIEAKDANQLEVLYRENGTGLFKVEKIESIKWMFNEEPGTRNGHQV